MQRAKSGIVFLFLISSFFATSSAHAQWIAVDLCTYPETGLPVADGAPLADQWRSIGILFDADPPTVESVTCSSTQISTESMRSSVSLNRAQ